MKSKTSLFNVTIFKRNIKSVWPFWGLLSFVAVIPSLFLIMEWIRHGIDTTEFNPFEVKYMFYNAAIYLAPLVAFATAWIAAFFVWMYLYTAKSVGAFHSIPVTRAGLFVTNYLSGIVIMLIPYVIGGALFILTLIIIGVGFHMSVFVLIGAVIIDSIFFFSFATVIAMMTGNMFALPLLYLAFNFLALGIENLFNFVISNLLYGLSFSLSAKTDFLSPLVCLMRNMRTVREYSYNRIGELPETMTRDLIGVSLENGHIMLIYGAVGVIFAIIAFLMYRGKKSESAGDVVSFKPLKPIIHWIYTITGTVILGMLLYYIFSEAEIRGMNVIQGSLCFIAALAISYYTGLMLLEKTVRVFNKKTFVGFAVGAVLSVICCFCMKYDVLGIEKRIPDASKVQEIQLYMGNSYTIDGSNKELVQKTMDFHKNIIENKDLLNARFFDSNDDEEYVYDYVTIEYVLKNAEVLRREYRIVVPRNNKTEFDKAYVDFVSDKDLIKTLLHEDDEYYLSGGYFTLYSYNSELSAKYGLNTDSWDLSDWQTKTIYDAVKKDLEAGNWKPGRNNYSNESNNVIGYIAVFFEKRIERSEDTYYYNTDDLDVNLTPDMTYTLEAIRDLLGLSEEQMEEFVDILIKANEPVDEYQYYYDK